MRRLTRLHRYYCRATGRLPMRGPLPRFRLAEVRGMLRLSHTLHDTAPNPTARKRALLERLCRLLRADSGVCVVSQAEAAPPGSVGPIQSVTVSVVRYAMTEQDAWALAARYRSGQGPRRRRRRAAAAERRPVPARGRARAPAAHDGLLPRGHYAESVLDMPGMKMQACVALLRRHPAGHPFTPRERAMLDVVHSELTWLYGPNLPLQSPDGLPLPPRQRQTLQLLLAGNSEKEIAGQMGLSHNTVHHYVKAIHRHFGVSSRSELLARWVRKATTGA